ncbi:unnamed protein product [Diplocarpon coronariae]
MDLHWIGHRHRGQIRDFVGSAATTTTTIATQPTVAMLDGNPARNTADL